MTKDIKIKQNEFEEAMKRYENKRSYKIFNKIISIINISLQIFIVILVLPLKIGLLWQVGAFIAAFILTDFINGIVHMYMDKNDNYKSIAGPLIANFHLHHKSPVYKKANLLLVYFNETGSKIWLCGFQAVSVFLIGFMNISPIISFILVYFVILSSIAELSHYLCHVSNSRTTGYLQDNLIKTLLDQDVF